MKDNLAKSGESSAVGAFGGLSKPGDKLSARVTNSNRKVLKIQTSNVIYSATQYPNGTVVETKTIKSK